MANPWLATSLPKVALFGGLLALTFVPSVPVGVSPFDDAENSGRFLGTLWQVVAAAVGVSVALIAFVLQAFASSSERRPGMTLREFAARTRIFGFLEFAAAVLLINGLALLGLGAAPSGWPGAMTALLGFLTLVGLLALVPQLILGAVEPARLLSLRRSIVLNLTKRAIEAQLLGQVAATEVDRLASSSAVRMGAAYEAGPDILVSRKAGVVHDVWLAPLCRIANSVSRQSDEHVEVLVELESAVSEGAPIIRVPVNLPTWRRRWIRYAVRIRSDRRPAPSSLLIETLSALRQQAVGAVRRGDEEEWRAISSLLEHQLLMLPQATNTAGIPFDGAVSKPGAFGYGPSSRVFDILSDVLELAISRGSKRVAENCLYFPLAVAREAAPLKAAGLVEQCADAYAHAYALSYVPLDGSTQRMQSLVRERAIDSLADLIRTVGLARLVWLGSGDELAVDSALTNVKRVSRSLVAVFREAITHADRGSFDRIRRKLDEQFEHADTWSETAESKALKEIATDLDVAHVALAAWALEQGVARGRHDQTVVFSMASSLLEPMSPDRLIDAWQTLLDTSTHPLAHSTSWWYYDEEEGGAQVLDAKSKHVVALVAGLWAAGVRGPLRPYPTEWVGHNLDALLGGVEKVRRDFDQYPLTLLGSEAVENVQDDHDPSDEDAQRLIGLQRVEAFFRESHAAEVAEDQRRTAAAMLDQDLVAEFDLRVREAASEQRVLRELLKAKGRWEQDPDMTWSGRGFKKFSDKRFYSGEPGYVGQARIAETMGFRAGRAELGDLAEALSEVRPADGDNLPSAVRDAISELRGAGADPSLVIFPTSVDLRLELGLGYRMEPGALCHTPVPEKFHDLFDGLVEGVPAMDLPDLEDRLFVLDLAALSMRETPTSDGSGVKASVTAFSEEEAWRLIRIEAEKSPDGREPSIEWVREVQQSVKLTVEIGWILRLVDPSLVRALVVPAELRMRR